MAGYDNVKLGLIDRFRVNLERRKAERAESERLRHEPNGGYRPDYSVANQLEKQLLDKKIAKLQAKEEKKLLKQNQKNQVQLLGTGKAKSPLDNMLDKPLKTNEEAYENIVELNHYMSYPHGENTQNEINMIHQKFQAIPEDILKKGMEIYELDKTLLKMTETMGIEEKLKIQSEIVNNPQLAEQLNYLRYHPEEARNVKGEIWNYQAIYAKMVADERSEQNYQITSSKEIPDTLEQYKVEVPHYEPQKGTSDFGETSRDEKQDVR